MAYQIAKVLLTAALVVAIAEISKRSTSLGAFLASLPLTSLLAFIWLYGETGDAARIAELSRSIFWYVLPSLVLFLVLPAMIAHGFGFWPSLAAGSLLTFAAYAALLQLAAQFGLKI